MSVCHLLAGRPERDSAFGHHLGEPDIRINEREISNRLAVLSKVIQHQREGQLTFGIRIKPKLYPVEILTQRLQSLRRARNSAEDAHDCFAVRRRPDDQPCPHSNYRICPASCLQTPSGSIVSGDDERFQNRYLLVNYQSL